MRGDLKVVYDSVMNFGEMDVYSGLKLLLDAEYYLYNKKDVEKYCLYMEKYFAGLGDGDSFPRLYRGVGVAVRGARGKDHAGSGSSGNQLVERSSEKQVAAGNADALFVNVRRLL